MLFTREAETLVLRDYQIGAIDDLRDGIRAGSRRQILAIPTGGGKTETAIHLIQEAIKKGSRIWFTVDRLALVDQTIDRMGKYGINPGVMQGDHFLTNSEHLVQVVSVQTLGKRHVADHLLPDLIIVDEAHIRSRPLMNVIERAVHAKVVGLTATPFTAGMAVDWDGLVSPVTVNELIASGALCPLRIKACVAPDMVGAKKTAGEYEAEEAGSRGITIVGNVADTWIEQTAATFGGPVKTIVFTPSVAHGAELCREFASRGFNFQQLSHLDRDDNERRAKIAEFRQPDSAIDGLVSCAVLTRGFDVPEILCGISCKPYRKSFSSHIQEMGRVMRAAPGKEFGLWLCHSNNVISFAEETAWLFENGVSSLSEAAKQDSTPREPTDAVKRKHFCPDCETQVILGICPACGWERPAIGTVQIIQGELIDFEISTKHAFQPRPGLRAECLSKPQSVWNAAVAYCSASTRKGPDAARKWAFGIWNGIYPGAKMPSGLYDAPYDAARVQPDEWSLIEREIKRFRKSSGRRAA
ncbi:MAG: DEAD/DEAH box helicase [Devosia sp.]